MTTWPEGENQALHPRLAVRLPRAMMNAALGILLLVLGGLTPATADIFCYNLEQVAAILPKNTSSSPVHFATTIFGQAPDVVYALALCRGDIANDSACGECVANTFGRILSMTPPPQQQCCKAGYFYGEDCVLFFSNDDILTSSNSTGENGGDTPLFTGWNDKNITGDPYDVVLAVVHLYDLLAATVQAAANRTTPGLFATGIMHSPMVFYSMAQCTPDLSADDCLECLSRPLAIMMTSSSMLLRQGARISVIRCSLRYETYMFYDSPPMLLVGPPSTSEPTPAPTPTTTPKHKRRLSRFWAIPVIAVPLGAAACLCFIFCSFWLRKYRKGTKRTGDMQREDELVWQGKNEFSVFDFEQLLKATNNFSEENKLGQGGFGAVYKGQFPEGLEIAVKRLSSHSGQGFNEFKNEVQLIAKFQHSNLVRLLGCCSLQEEKILIYEYLPNKSLDFFIFDENRRALLDWNKRKAIIEGIAHGLLYLHKHSRLRVIHRDLKPSNILLDSEMNPKISDFGLAKIFTSNNTEGSTTRRVVGTYGYMAPEYACEGLFSMKSDVFSFGVIVLEILGGRRNSGSSECGNFINLLGYAWQLCREGRWGELVDVSLLPICDSEEIMKCMNIALLCVQEKAADRPTMLDVVAMLSSKTMALVEPKYPAYFNLMRVGNEEASAATRPSSINDMTISVITGR